MLNLKGGLGFFFFCLFVCLFLFCFFFFFFFLFFVVFCLGFAFSYSIKSSTLPGQLHVRNVVSASLSTVLLKALLSKIPPLCWKSQVVLLVSTYAR